LILARAGGQTYFGKQNIQNGTIQEKKKTKLVGTAFLNLKLIQKTSSNYSNKTKVYVEWMKVKNHEAEELSLQRDAEYSADDQHAHADHQTELQRSSYNQQALRTTRPARETAKYCTQTGLERNYEILLKKKKVQNPTK
jgi:hypothetical protein